MPLQEVRPGDDRPLQDVADHLARSHKIVIVTGAGISTSCGIPDFRSKDGLYNLIPEHRYPTPPPSAPSTPSRKRQAGSLDYESTPPSSQTSISSSASQRSTPTSKLRGQDLFDARVWSDPGTAAVFYQFIASMRHKIRQDVRESSLTHKFIRTLRDGGRLLRCYTQNIDGLEAREGLDTDMSHGKGNKRRFMRKTFQAPRPAHTLNTDFDGGCEVVQLHGELDNVRCTLCQSIRLWEEADTLAYLDGEAPGCAQCISKNDEREAKGKRGTSIGLVRPNIVLYGEEHPLNHLLAPFVPSDINSAPELLIIMGTSLKVFGLQKLVRDFAKAIHSRKDGKGKVILVNRTKPAESIWEDVIDEYVAMDCDEWVEDLRVRREDLWLRQGELDLRISKSVSKRKHTNCDENSRPAKKPKVMPERMVSVDVPTRSYMTGSCMSSANHCVEGNLPTPTPSQESQEMNRAPAMVTPSTPHYRRVWKVNMQKHQLAAFVSPMTPRRPPSRKSFKTPVFPALTKMVTPKRPSYSPLRKSFKPPPMSVAVFQSPQRPEYSPMTTPFGRKRLVQIYADPDAEIANSDDDKKAAEEEFQDTIVGISPTKINMRRPTSEFVSNAETIRAWATKTTNENRLSDIVKLPRGSGS